MTARPVPAGQRSTRPDPSSRNASVSRETRAALDAYIPFLEEAVRVGALGPSEGGRLAARHVEDALAFLPLAAGLTGAITDVGSGAGLPGIPLALALPDRTVTLLERSAGRARFLRRVVRALELGSRVEVVEGDARSTPLATRGVVARASLPPGELLVAVRASVAAWAVVWVGATQPIPTEFRLEAGAHGRHLAVWERAPV